jgi:hypothetical protein
LIATVRETPGALSTGPPPFILAREAVSLARGKSLLRRILI